MRWLICLGDKLDIGEYLVQKVLMIDDQVPPFRPELITDFGLSKIEKQKISKEGLEKLLKRLFQMKLIKFQ